jgi:hypothetical protein
MSEIRIAELESQIETLKRRNQDLETKILQAEASAERAIIESHLRTAAVEAGVVIGALPDVVSRAMRTGQWKLDSRGKLLRQQDGQPDVDTKGDYVTPKAWLKSLKAESPYYFADPQEQAQKSQDEPPNPWSAEHWNLTKQSRVAAISLDEARRMAKAAGSSLDATQPPKSKAQS